jgi:hypothetical protein
MHEYIAHPGLRIYVHKLSGRLICNLHSNNQAQNIYLTDTDLEFQDQDPHEAEPSGRLSAVGLDLRIERLSGALELEFEGTCGSHANWKVYGLDQLGAKAMYASAATQAEAAQTPKVEVKEAAVQTRFDKAVTTTYGVDPESEWVSLRGRLEVGDSRFSQPNSVLSLCEAEALLLLRKDIGEVRNQRKISLRDGTRM